MSASKINIIGKNWPWSFLSIKTVKDCVSWCFFREISGGGNPFYHQQTRFTAKSLHAVYSALCKACFYNLRDSQLYYHLCCFHLRVLSFVWNSDNESGVARQTAPGLTPGLRRPCSRTRGGSWRTGQILPPL